MANQQGDDSGLLELALFAGGGGGILGGKLLGWRTICAVEIDAYAASVLAARQNDGCLEGFPIWSDIRSFRQTNPMCREMFKALRSVRDRLVISGGFPCQEISAAGNGKGLQGERSGLWSEQKRIIHKIRPRYAFVENAPTLTSRGLGTILRDLAEMGYDASWGVLGADDVGMPHHRERIWIVADNLQIGVSRHITSGSISEARQRGKSLSASVLSSDPLEPGNSWPQPLLRGIHARLANSVDRIACIGNGQCPSVVKLAWETLRFS